MHHLIPLLFLSWSLSSRSFSYPAPALCIDRSSKLQNPGRSIQEKKTQDNKYSAALGHAPSTGVHAETSRQRHITTRPTKRSADACVSLLTVLATPFAMSVNFSIAHPSQLMMMIVLSCQSCAVCASTRYPRKSV